MKKLLLFLLLFVSLCTSTKAQISSEKEMKDRILLKLAPLSFFDIDNTIQGGVEIPFKNRKFTFHQELGYGHSAFSPLYFHWKDDTNKWTFRSRTQLRYYVHEWGSGRMYLAGEYLHKVVTTKGNAWSGRNCDQPNGECEYYADSEVRRRKNVSALHAKIGWHFYFGNRMTLDLYVGGGYRTVSFTKKPENGGYIQFGSYSWLDDLNPSLATGFLLGIPLGRQK